MRSKVFKVTIVVSCMLLVLYTGQAFSQKLDTLPEKSVISLELRDKSLKFVAEEIFKQTGYKVVFDKKWNDLPLSGQYTGVTLEEFFRRALRKQNVSLSYDDKSNVVVLHFFGDRNIGIKKNIDQASDNASIVQAIEEIKALHEEQRQELSTYLKDPESVDPVSGMKLVDIKDLHGTQQKELENLKNDPETIDPLSGMTNAEIKKLNNSQSAESKRSAQDPNLVDPESGMTRAEITRLHDEQHVELEQLKKNQEAAALIIPDD